MTLPVQSGRRNRWILDAVLLVAAFLLGFIPQYLSSNRAAADLQARDQQIKQLQQQATLSRLRDLSSLLYLEVTRNNYGIARQRASALFDLVRATINTGPDDALKAGLVSTLAQRDEIVSKLAKADAGVEKDVRDLMDRLFQLTFK
ncbi:MAG: hypothetical protein ABI822_28135 [Bryobacteraceae bacterium]